MNSSRDKLKTTSRANDLFLLMLNLSQITTKERIIVVFTEAIEEIWPNIGAICAQSKLKGRDIFIQISTGTVNYGYLCIDHFCKLTEEDIALLHNACGMLAVILRKNEHEALLADEKLHLEKLVEEKTRHLYSEIEEHKTTQGVMQEAQAETLRLLDLADKSRRALLSVAEDEKNARQELTRLNEELEQRVINRTMQLQATNKELEAFSYSVSHDLRAPVRAMGSFAKILNDDHSSSMDAEGIRLLQIIIDNAEKMGKLIDDLLSFSRLVRQEMNFSKIDMHSLAESVFQELLAEADRGKTQFRLHDIPEAYGDLSMLRQVWVNLIDNAIKFSSKKPERIIEIGSTTRDSENIYYIKDNGAGFDMAYSKKLFGVFQRLHSVKDFEGTGVGLAIVQRMVLRLNGRVWAEGKKNEGATFYFALPH